MPNYFLKCKKYGDIFKNLIFANHKFVEIKSSEILEQIWKRRGPGNDEYPFEMCLGNLEYGMNIFLKTCSAFLVIPIIHNRIIH